MIHGRGVRVTRWLPLLILAVTTSAVAQAGVPGPNLWLQAGLGRGSTGWTVPVAGTVVYRGHIISGHFAETSPELLEGGRTLREYGVRYGRSLSAGPARVSLTAGLGRVTCEDSAGCGTSDPGGNPLWSRSVLGVPLGAQLSFPLTGFAGLGLQGFANVNGIESHGGAAIVVLLGKLR